MSVDRSVNQTRVSVAYAPSGSHYRAVLQVTVRLGKNPSPEEHLAYQAFLAALQRFKEEVS
jgi:hypothetical protein